MSKVSKIRLKRCEISLGSEAKILSKISCKIGRHFLQAHINSGSSISVASTDLYTKLLDDKCSFEDGKGTFHEIDDSIPNQEYRITSVNVQVIGETKTIKLVAFPNFWVKRTILGIDFLASKSKVKSNVQEVSQVPGDSVLEPEKKVHLEENNNKNQPITLMDWIFDFNNLKKPLFNILNEETADDDDLFAICAFMKRLPRPVSPIRCSDKPRNKKLDDIELVNTRDNTTTDKLPDTSPKSTKIVSS